MGPEIEKQERAAQKNGTNHKSIPYGTMKSTGKN
jgi:hypothetical protein